MNLLAIDPGNEKSAYVLLDARGLPVDKGILPNAELLEFFSEAQATQCAVEMIASYGMAVGKTVFETVRWIGRFEQRWNDTHSVSAELVYRKECKMHLCNAMKAKDSNIRQALIDKFGPDKATAIGLKKTPGPLYGFKKDEWAALAVAVTYAETRI